MEEDNNKTVETTPDISVQEESKMQTVANSRVRFKIHIGLFVIVNLLLWVLYFTLFNAIVTDFTIKWAILKVFICITVVWLLVAILHYCIAFKWNKTFVEKELGRIRKQRSNQLKELERLKAQIAASKANQDAQKQE
ncbi:MAG: 2TM domain-containing protein [Bacteroidales bacterium]|jgi:protein-S-isoprenylcysteine O-methyltransferase Ste14|nr:2TM domain-containing protein [Bacteroidales bacterium]